MDWKLTGLVTVAHAEGPDVARSAAGRSGAEAIWLPTALLPRFGVHRSAGSGDQVTAGFRVGDTPVELRLRLATAARVSRAWAFHELARDEPVNLLDSWPETHQH